MQLTDLTNNALDAFRGAGNYVTALTTPTLRLGVTGLARSGKTVFITALVRNLLEDGRLPFFTAMAQGRVRNIFLEPQPDDDVPRFSYEDHLSALAADPPNWPRSTSRVSQLRLTVEYDSQNPLRRALGSSLLHIDIVDYPGEWLIDLPLLEQKFAAWSRDALELARHPSRAAHAKPFLDFLNELDGPDQPSRSDASAYGCENLARRGAALFTAYLVDARADDHALSIAGPGRFLMPGDLDGSPLLTFFPLDPFVPVAAKIEDRPRASAPAPVVQDALLALLSRRYDSYKSHVVKPFFTKHFVKLDRQIVLVDALAALNAGPSALRDLQNSLEKILASFRPGANSWLSSLLYRRIDRLVFAATKADHLHHSSHDRLEAILRLLTKKAMQRAEARGANVNVLALAALRSTREVDVAQGADILHAIQGTPLPGERLGDVTFDGMSEVAIFPGDLPDDPATAIDHGRAPAQRDELEMRFIRFRPQRLQLGARAGDVNDTREPNNTGAAMQKLEYHRAPPHIRLDRALEFLIGDQLL